MFLHLKIIFTLSSLFVFAKSLNQFKRFRLFVVGCFKSYKEKITASLDVGDSFEGFPLFTEFLVVY